MATRLMLMAICVWLVPAAALAQTTGSAVDQVINADLNLRLVSGTFEQALIQQAATFPFGSSSGGFHWVFNPALGTSERRQSFGSVFAERPSTVGRRRFSVGGLFQRVGFASIAGQPLESIETVPVISGAITRPTVTSLDVEIQRTIVSAWYGITDRIDAGVVIPIGHSSAAGTSTTTIVCTVPDPFFCPAGGTRALPAVSATGSSSGLGDIAVRSKFALLSIRPGSTAGDDRAFELAASAELRLPSGDPEKLLGRGKSQVQAIVLGASSLRGIAPHFNLGYTFGGSGLTCDPRNLVNCVTPSGVTQEPSPEINYTFGADVALRRVTVGADIVGRTLKDAAVFEYGTLPVDTATAKFFRVTSGNVTLLLAGIGAKALIGSSWLASFGVLFPLNDNGIKPTVAPSVSVERTF